MSWLQPLEPATFRLIVEKKPRALGSGRPNVVPEKDKRKIRECINRLEGRLRMKKIREFAKKYGVNPRTIQKYGEK